MKYDQIEDFSIEDFSDEQFRRLIGGVGGNKFRKMQHKDAKVRRRKERRAR